MFTCLLIALLVGFPGMLLQMMVSKLRYIAVSFACLSLACILTITSLPTYCLLISALAFSLIFIVYILMLVLKHTQHQ